MPLAPAAYRTGVPTMAAEPHDDGGTRVDDCSPAPRKIVVSRCVLPPLWPSPGVSRRAGCTCVQVPALRLRALRAERTRGMESGGARTSDGLANGVKHVRTCETMGDVTRTCASEA